MLGKINFLTFPDKHVTFSDENWGFLPAVPPELSTGTTEGRGDLAIEVGRI